MKKYDVAVLGGSIGGVLAALSAAKMGKKVILTENTDWVGGQFTSQAVPPDEHKWIEEFGCTKTYREFRDKIRRFYRENYPMKENLKENFDPGLSSVSRLAHDPRVALHLFKEMLLPFEISGHIDVRLETRVVSSHVENDTIQFVVVKGKDEVLESIKADYYIDATDIGELLPLVGAEYVVGAESREMTGEPHALDTYLPQDMQPVTWVAALEYREGESHIIEKPEMYDYFKAYKQPYGPHSILSHYGPDSTHKCAKEFGVFTDKERGLFPLWSYRRIIAPENHEKGYALYDVTLLNWPQNDYFMGNLFEVEDPEKQAFLAQQLTLSFVYWLQTEAPTEDGTLGYPGMKLCGKSVGTTTGLAKAPYIRESRRIKAKYTITESEMNAELREDLKVHEDSVGVGCYHIDLHVTTVTNTFTYWNSWPFELPLGAMIPVRIKNLIPGCKNIGTTHLTNGCYRLHPVEWNVGEVAGYLSAFCMEKGKTVQEVYEDKALVKEFQNLVISKGVEIHWPADKVHVI